MSEGVMNEGVLRADTVHEAVTDDQRAAVAQFVAAVPMAAMVHSMHYEVVGANTLCEGVLGCAVDDMIGRPVADFVPLGDRASATRIAVQLEHRYPEAGPTDHGRPIGALRRVRRVDGEVVSCWMHVGISTIAGRRFIVALLDLVNPVVDDTVHWRDRAERDELTGLLRRGPLLAHVDEWIAEDLPVALAFVDVDRLKSINDAHGHPAGDAVLEAAGRRLHQWSPRGSVVGRYAGDEFVFAVTFDGSTGLDTAEVTESVRSAICGEPVPFGSNLLGVSVSVGVAVREPGEPRDRLIQRADALMYRDKASRTT
ncbi:GGDEF domain-containing protein [Rhodococcus sp. IEGM 1374]|uniref:sensor domain-containing diguanylate cyclase n=2 Tax=unclassified Rhodococcus (in: high G+C Gram-positive bacteria) TaxID=192944 RepID=UPI002952F598|nr:GGDEF domain-containing protein [Rhodococcus sp. IEGM 1374]MDV7992153.1 GGDEF domain-containing protein [Rhodococcus sp. IEGM 1374]